MTGRIGLGICAALACIAVPASAVTITGLRDSQVAWGYGQYAPGGDCARQPQITVDATGFTFSVGGQAIHPPRFEQALDFVRDADPAKIAWFFPFIRSGSDFGPILLTLDRRNGVPSIMLENEAGPGRPLAGPHGALLAASPYKRCSKVNAAR